MTPAVWTAFFLGALLGWLIEWIIDYFFWRRQRAAEAERLQALVKQAQEEAKKAGTSADEHKQRAAKAESEAAAHGEKVAILEAELRARAEASAQQEKELADLKGELSLWGQKEQSFLDEKKALELKLEEQAAAASPTSISDADSEALRARAAFLEEQNHSLQSQAAEVNAFKSRIADLEAEAASRPSAARLTELEEALERANSELRQSEQDLASFHRAAEEAEVLRRRLDACQEERKSLDAEVMRLKAEKGAQALSMAAPLLAGINQEGLNLSGQEPRSKDPLEKILGIGKVFEKKLWDAGILTFSDLAAADPDRLREIINPESWQKIEPDEWIAEARKRAGGA